MVHCVFILSAVWPKWFQTLWRARDLQDLTSTEACRVQSFGVLSFAMRLAMTFLLKNGLRTPGYPGDSAKLRTQAGDSRPNPVFSGLLEGIHNIRT